MARSLDIEGLIEAAFVSNLPSYVDTGVTVKSWDDIEEKDLTPSVKIKATVTNEQDGTLNLSCASNVIVDIASFTSKRIDENGTVANGIRGDCREFINQDNVVTLLNATAGLLVYNQGVIPQGSSDLESDKVWQKNTSVLIVATSTDPTP